MVELLAVERNESCERAGKGEGEEGICLTRLLRPETRGERRGGRLDLISTKQTLSYVVVEEESLNVWGEKLAKKG